MAGLVDDATLAPDARRTQPAAVSWRPGADPAVAELVGDRFGDQVVARSVDPLLAGVYAGSAATIGLRSAAADAGRGAGPRVRAASPTPVREALPARRRARLGVRRDRRRLPGAGRRTRPRAPTSLGAGRRCDRIERRRQAAGQLIDDEGEQLACRRGGARRPGAAAADDRGAASRPRTAAAAGGSAVASTALVALALPGGTPLPEQSGVLVAAGSALHAKAITLSSRKWGRRGNVELVRLSFGRFGDDVGPRHRRRGPAVVGGRGPCRSVFGVTGRSGRLPRAALDRRDAAVRAGPRRAGRRAARRSAADAGGGGRLPGRHRRARLCGVGHAGRAGVPPGLRRARGTMGSWPSSTTTRSTP